MMTFFSLAQRGIPVKSQTGAQGLPAVQLALSLCMIDRCATEERPGVHGSAACRHAHADAMVVQGSPGLHGGQPRVGLELPSSDPPLTGPIDSGVWRSPRCGAILLLAQANLLLHDLS